MPGDREKVEMLMFKLGERGKFQLFIHFLLAFTYVTILFNHVIMAFHGSPVSHSCEPFEEKRNGSSLLFLGNKTNGDDTSYPATDDLFNQKWTMTPGKCSSVLHFEDGNNKTVVCGKGQWKYSPKYEEHNLVSEFDLVCSDKSLASVATTIYFAGVMLGGLVFGDLADRFGRLPTILFCIYSSTIVCFATAFSLNYTMFVLLRFLTGVLMQGLQTSVYTMIMELYRAEYRPFGGAIAECFFAIGVMLLSGLAYFFRNWTHLQIATSVFSALSFFYIFVLPESLRWLITKGKMDRAEKLIQRICRWNKIPYPDQVLKEIRERKVSSVEASPVKNFNVSHLFRTPKMRKYTLIMAFLWLVTATCYYGMTFKMAGFKANRYLIIFIGGLIECVVYAASIPIMNFFGRKKPLCFGFITAGVMCISSGVCDDFVEGYDLLTAGFGLVGRCSLALVFGVVFVYTSELYPTVIRNIGIGFACFWARAGGVLAPQINHWGKKAVGLDAIYLFGMLSFLAGGLILLLKETHNTKLADSIEEVENCKSKDNVRLENVEENNCHASDPCL